MKNQKEIVVITAVVNKAHVDELPTYLEQIQPIFIKNGAKPIGRYKTVQNIVGTDGPEIISIFEFDNTDAIDTMVQSEEFTGLAELRARVFSTLNMMLCAS